MPTYFAGRVNGAAGTINLGSDVAATRNATGSYTLTITQPSTVTRFLMVVVTPSANNPPSPDTRPVFARVTSTSRTAVTGQPKVTTVLVMLSDFTGTPVDCDFEFVAVERTGS